MPGIISLGDALHGRRERRVVVRDSDGTPRDEVVFIDDRHHDEPISAPIEQRRRSF